MKPVKSQTDGLHCGSKCVNMRVVSDVKLIGPYRLLEELGRGGMGVVFRGYDPAIGAL